ncbi:MAG TPA: hypothetical protein HA277_04000 [Methanosphaera sp.]|nr:hypothetical protein [Methanosphaera sp.]HIJ15546.1 hypothetical protein [Methanosphaera sp.]
MDALTIIIMMVLFILAMLFVFSTALLTPYIGKKNLISVILLGLIVGLAAGAFLLSPIVEDIPDFTRTIVEESVDGTDVIELDLSTNGNLTQIIQNISSIGGVEKVDYNGITIKIDEEFDSDTEKRLLTQALNNSNENITDVIEQNNNTFLVVIAEGGDPQGVLNSIYSTFSRETYTHLRYTSMSANATVQANNVTKILNRLSENDVVVLNVTGPTETQIAFLNKFMPNGINIILFSGVLGIIVAAAGFFVDSLITFINNFRKKRKKKPSEQENIKRKVVPGTNKGSPRRNRRRKANSIDIFDESFDESPKQNIGSNKRFKQLTVDDFKSEDEIKTAKEEKTKRGFSLFNRSSKSDKQPKQKKESRKENKRSKNSGTPRFRPKRRE